MNGLPSLAKFLIFTGIFLLAAGFLLLLLGKISPLGRLPGDIYFQKGKFSFYFPLVTCLLLSLILTLVFNLLRR